ncbi:MAG: oligosaccharide flippase family protein [Solirubrobacteraceae bacterium]
MVHYLRRLLTAGAAYQAGDLLAKAIALVTLPLYTRHLTKADYGYAETLLTAVILLSILLRLGVGEAFVRFWFDDEDEARRRRIAGSAVLFVAATSTLAAGAALLLAGAISQALLGFRDATLVSIAVLGLWSFTNLEIAYALLRVEERATTYLRATICNVLLTISLTVFLVVVRGDGARGLLLGNYAATSTVLLGLWFVERDKLRGASRAALRGMLRFGLPTVPSDAAVYALQVVDRAFLLRTRSPDAAGLYSLAIKLATVVFVAVRGFQYAWPPLAYSVRDDHEAARLYSLVTTYYVLATGSVVAGVALLGRWGVRLLAAPKFYGAHSALPWLALGWALYGLYLVFVVIAGRARVTNRNLPAALAGLIVNVAGLLLLVPAFGIAGAGIALCCAYAVMLLVMYRLTRSLFSVGFEWLRLAKLIAVLAGVAVAGELLLPTGGADGLLLRTGALALVAPLLLAVRFFAPGELRRGWDLLRSLRPRPRAPDPPAA